MKNLLFLALILIRVNTFSQNIQLEANLSYGSTVLSNIGGYVDSLGNEYALVGTYDGLDIVDVSNPANPIIRFSVNGPQSSWREVKTYRKYAYVTTEGGGGLTVVDLSNLPVSVNQKQYTGDGAISGQLNAIHALHCDTAKGFLYLYGCDLNAGNTIFIDLADPWNPAYAGEFLYPGGGNAEYVHDGIAMNDTLYEGHIYAGFFAVVDVRNKSNPILLATQSTPTAFTHNTWLSDDHKTLFTTDENSGSYLAAYDISDLTNIEERSRYQTSPGSGAIVHNTHILNDYAVTSWYKEGVVIVDVSRPDNPVEVGKYDTYPQGNGDGFNGCWGVYPFLPSGTIVASDIDNGLFVLTPTYKRGCYLEGIVTDSISGAFINGATLNLLTTGIVRNSNSSGEFRMGTAASGTYDLSVSRPGYYSKTISGIALSNGVLNQLQIQLVPIPTFSFSGLVSDSLTGQPVPNTTIYVDGGGLHYTAVSNSNGQFTFPGIIPDTYTLSAGVWGYRTLCSTITLTQGMPLNIVLEQGYYDDFTFDYGWTVTGTSANSWERGDPVGTFNGNNIEINPENDVTGDCGSICFVTDNGGSPYNAHDVDNGNTVLTSPVFDATIYTDPVLNYYRRFLDIDGQGTPNDAMQITLSNGITSVTLETVSPNDPGNGFWQASSFQIKSLITLTQTMTLSIEVFDDAPGNIVEGAFDQFEITGDLITGQPSIHSESDAINVYPNPFHGELILHAAVKPEEQMKRVIIKDLLGKTVLEKICPGKDEKIVLGNELHPGMYVLILDNGQRKEVRKIVKEY